MVIEMKVAKIKSKKTTKNIETKEEYSIKNMFKIVLIILIVFGVFYFITTLLIDRRKVEDSNSQAVIDSSKITLSQILNRVDEEYYVIATRKSLYESSYVETNYIQLYNNYINKYKQKENAYPVYYVDLDNALNKKYIGEEMNITNEISELVLNDEVLFKIKSGKIEKTYIGKEEILDKLSRL